MVLHRLSTEINEYTDSPWAHVCARGVPNIMASINEKGSWSDRYKRWWVTSSLLIAEKEIVVKD